MSKILIKAIGLLLFTLITIFALPTPAYANGRALGGLINIPISIIIAVYLIYFSIRFSLKVTKDKSSGIQIISYVASIFLSVILAFMIIYLPGVLFTTQAFALTIPTLIALVLTQVSLRITKGEDRYVRNLSIVASIIYLFLIIILIMGLYHSIKNVLFLYTPEFIDAHFGEGYKTNLLAGGCGIAVMLILFILNVYYLLKHFLKKRNKVK